MMNLVNQIVTHKSLGDGKITGQSDNYLTITFGTEDKEFIFPDSFKDFLRVKDSVIDEQVRIYLSKFYEEQQHIKVEKKREQLQNNKSAMKTYPDASIALKSNSYDENRSNEQIVFNGVHRDKINYNNVKVEHHRMFEQEALLPIIDLEIKLTNTAKKNIFNIISNDYSNKDYDSNYYDEDDSNFAYFLSEYIAEASDYIVYLQNCSQGYDDERISIVLAVDSANVNNKKLLSKLNNSTILVEGKNILQSQKTSFLMTNIKKIPAVIGRASNRSIKSRVRFYYGYNIRAKGMPVDILNCVFELPIPIEQSNLIAQRIQHWDDYLKIIEETAQKSEVVFDYIAYKQGQKLDILSFLVDKRLLDWNKVKKLINSQVKLVEDIDDSENEKVYDGPIIGTVDSYNDIKGEIKIELDEDYKEKAQSGVMDFPLKGKLYITKLGDLAQAKRLRDGLKKLQFGQAVNPFLDNFLFNSEAARVPDYINKIELDTSELLLKSLNKKQKEAVEGVLNAEDLYLIQGPPGTGKTTVIAEICYQNAIRGMKTLIASQTNLAVDNALSRLVHSPKIRALRKGNSKSIQEEGKPFTEDNVIKTWLAKTSESCESAIKSKKDRMEILNNLEGKLLELVQSFSIFKSIKNDIGLLTSNKDKYTKLLEWANHNCEDFYKFINETVGLPHQTDCSLIDNYFVNYSDAPIELIEEFKCCINKIKEKELVINIIQQGICQIKEYKVVVDDQLSVVIRELTKVSKGTLPDIKTSYIEDVNNHDVMAFKKNVELHMLQKPNWFIRILGLSSRWDRSAIDLINYGQGLLKLFENKLEDHSKELLNIINSREYIEIKELLDSLCVKLIEAYDSRKADLEISLTNCQNKITDQMQELSSVIQFINEYNCCIPDDIEFNRSIEVLVKEENIEKFYRKLWETELKYNSKYVSIVNEWINRINSSNDKETHNTLKQIYIDNANVIGITCVQSGSKNFSEKYPDFDVVIIDEVSKATPPELLLPMLKAKKVVLVGDHKQLPPMIGSETFDELAEQYSYSKESLEHIKKSLFEELYNSAPEKLKTMLNVQYRMHKVIMDTINQFYKDEDEEGLECGIEDPDEKKQHNCENNVIKKEHHALWVDIPLIKANEEKKVQGSESCYNEVEVEYIKKILININMGLRQNKFSGKKEVGVITFYAAQTKLLDNELRNPEFIKNIDLLSMRIGTVDRFQGMERPIVIASFVRNNSKGDIGFAKDSKRINVALSRAQELLIIVGCSELFCYETRYVDAAEKYRTVLKIIDEHGGLKDALEFN